ncbi:Histidine triad nucleotide-binding protein 3 [Takifugu flavidus]|uniref:Adenosine 5'-monophosphoramidase HINT3 n=1 Tax=Takifugu flavidus TaxID=433684 RepID=A0A5C6PKU1_9TELE|nr:Histidine triad nucleotide-binding protein 3 [Takifugu flavidus]
MAALDATQPAQVDTTKNSNVSTEGYDRKCIFCKIVNKEMETELLHCDEEMSCFKDIRPGAPHHYLVVPTKHVGNCKSLSKEHVPLVQRMVELGKEILQKNNVTDLSDVRFGFHWPPFCSVTHLHLHILAPASQMGFMSRLVYRLNSYWFITADQLIELLTSKEETNISPSISTSPCFLTLRRILNAQKTVEMIVDFRKVTAPLPPLALMDSPITIADSFRFLGTTITRDLKWEPTISSLIKKAQQRMFFLWQLRKLKLPPRMLAQFYTAIIESILTSSITVWYAGATVRDRLRLQRVVRAAEKVIGCRLPSIQDLYISRTRRRAGRRLRSIRTKTSRYMNSFFPSAIRLLNTK